MQYRTLSVLMSIALLLYLGAGNVRIAQAQGVAVDETVTALTQLCVEGMVSSSIWAIINSLILGCFGLIPLLNHITSCVFILNDAYTVFKPSVDFMSIAYQIPETFLGKVIYAPFGMLATFGLSTIGILTLLWGLLAQIPILNYILALMAIIISPLTMPLVQVFTFSTAYFGSVIAHIIEMWMVV